MVCLCGTPGVQQEGGLGAEGLSAERGSQLWAPPARCHASQLGDQPTPVQDTARLWDTASLHAAMIALIMLGAQRKL